MAESAPRNAVQVGEWAAELLRRESARLVAMLTGPFETHRDLIGRLRREIA